MKAVVKEAAKYTVKETLQGAGMYGATSIASELGITPRQQIIAMGGFSLYRGGKAVLKNPMIKSAINNSANIAKATVKDAILADSGRVVLNAGIGGQGKQLYNSFKKATAERKALREGIVSGESSISRVPGNINNIKLKGIDTLDNASDNKIITGYETTIAKRISKANITSIDIGKKDLDALRKKWKVPETDTVAVGKTDIPELKNFTFEGGSPEVRKEAGLPTLDEVSPNREFKAPYDYKANPRLAQFTRHAEEGVLNEFDEAIKRTDIKPKDVSGTLYVHQSNPRGVCNKCTKGLIKSFPKDKCGIFYQASKKYPNLTIVVTSEVDTSVKVNGLISFILKDGKIIK